MSKYNFFASLLKNVNKAANAGDIPELTKFLKDSNVFRSMAWKIHEMKSNAVQKMDDIAFKDDPHNKPTNHTHTHTHNHKHNKK